MISATNEADEGTSLIKRDYEGTSLIKRDYEGTSLIKRDYEGTSFLIISTLFGSRDAEVNAGNMTLSAISAKPEALLGRPSG